VIAERRINYFESHAGYCTPFAGVWWGVTHNAYVKNYNTWYGWPNLVTDHAQARLR
jgi:hypothetical protein